MSIQTSMTFSESVSPTKQSQDQFMNKVDMNKVERVDDIQRVDDMQNSRNVVENVQVNHRHNRTL
jgi:hypothetical protein